MDVPHRQLKALQYPRRLLTVAVTFYPLLVRPVILGTDGYAPPCRRVHISGRESNAHGVDRLRDVDNVARPVGHESNWSGQIWKMGFEPSDAVSSCSSRSLLDCKSTPRHCFRARGWHHPQHSRSLGLSSFCSSHHLGRGRLTIPGSLFSDGSCSAELIRIMCLRFDNPFLPPIVLQISSNDFICRGLYCWRTLCQSS